MLHIALDYAEQTTQWNQRLDDPRLCPNCDLPFDSRTSPYCCEECREQAAWVRQFRAAVENGVILSPEKQVAFGQKLWWILGGGLPLRETLIPDSAKRQVARRSRDLCEFCGSPMLKVENFGSGCNRPLHLRAVCQQCSKTKPFGDKEFIQSPNVIQILTDFGQRISSAKPERQCDDSATWDWRAFLAKRRQSSPVPTDALTKHQ